MIVPEVNIKLAEALQAGIDRVNLDALLELKPGMWIRSEWQYAGCSVCVMTAAYLAAHPDVDPKTLEEQVKQDLSQHVHADCRIETWMDDTFGKGWCQPILCAFDGGQSADHIVEAIRHGWTPEMIYRLDEGVMSGNAYRQALQKMIAEAPDA